MAALLAASFLTGGARAQNIDLAQKSLSLDVGMSEDVVTKTLGLNPISSSAGACGSMNGPVECKVYHYESGSKQLIVRFRRESGTWLSFSWDVFPRLEEPNARSGRH
jgi:hypothetical protein